jgi:predicted CXXCH cytochrome family protein
MKGRSSVKFSNLATGTLIMIFAFGNVVQSAIQGSDHDLTGMGTRLCEACHVSHNATGQTLWSSSAQGVFSGIAGLCYSCHDGSVTTVGTTTIFDQTKDQHVMVGEDCSSPDGCHDVHNQNPNGTGRFLAKEITRTNKSYCETCHDETPWEGAEPWGVHNTDNGHYTDGSTFICESCHSVHGAVMQTVNPEDLTNPILLGDDNTGEGYGEFCITCHAGVVPPPAVPGTGGVASADKFDYTELGSEGAHSKHPTHTTAGPYTVEGCGSCHVPMCADAPALEQYDLWQDNTNSAYCLSCHNSGGAPHLGEISHFSQAVPEDPTMNDGLLPQLPWSNELDEDGNPGPDFATATVNMMTCETCHSVHKKGFSGSNAGYLLRYPDDKMNTLCQACHTEN